RSRRRRIEVKAMALDRLRMVTRTSGSVLQHPGYEGTRVTPRRMLNLWLNRWEHRQLRSDLRSYPIKLIVEVTNICNLGCPACYTGDGQQGRARGHISPELYAKVLDELAPYLWRGEVCNRGEPPPRPDIYPMIAPAPPPGVSRLVNTNITVPLLAHKAATPAASALTLL